jgi:hypothetical protein
MSGKPERNKTMLVVIATAAIFMGFVLWMLQPAGAPADGGDAASEAASEAP